MKKILLIDNFDSFTFNLVDFLEIAGANVTVKRNDILPKELNIAKYDLLVISPGPSIPENAGYLLETIKTYANKIPTFGVCMGMEAITEAFGGSLKLVEPRHGRSSPIHHDNRGVFTDLKQDFAAGRYHSLATDRVPKDFVVTAHSADDHIIMGIRHKNLPIEAVQFHPESVLTMKENNGQKLINNVLKYLR